MAPLFGWLGDIVGTHVYVNGVPRALRRAWNFLGGVAVVDNPETGMLEVTITGGSNLVGAPDVSIGGRDINAGATRTARLQGATSVIVDSEAMVLIGVNDADEVQIGHLGIEVKGGGARATGWADPTGAQDLATKAYADALVAAGVPDTISKPGGFVIAADGIVPAVTSGVLHLAGNTGVRIRSGSEMLSLTGISNEPQRLVSIAERVRVIATSNEALNDATVDGVLLSVGDVVLLAGQSTPAQNGFRYWTGTTLGRLTPGYQTSDTMPPNTLAFATEGTHAGQCYRMSATTPVVIGTDAMAWSQFGAGGGGSYTAGDGLTLTGSAFSVDLTNTNKFTSTGAASRAAVLDASSRLIAAGVRRTAGDVVVETVTSGDVTIKAVDRLFAHGAGGNAGLDVALGGSVTVFAATGEALALTGDVVSATAATTLTETVGSASRIVTASGADRTETYNGAVNHVATAFRVGGMTLGGSVAGGALTGGRLVAFTSLWAFDDHKRMTFSGDGFEACVVAIDYAGSHAQGAILSCFIPAGEAGSIVVPTDFNATDWDPFDPDADYLVTACWTNNTVVSSGKNIGLRDTSVPTLVSATVNSSQPSRLVCVFSDVIVAPNVVGLSLTFSVGTARTITGILSGLGTTTVTFTLSGGISMGDDFDLVIGAGRTAQSLNGIRVATGTTAVTLSGFALPGALPGATHMWRASDMETTGGDVDSVADPIGGLTLNASAANPQVSTMGTNSVPCWEIVATSYLTADTPAGEVMTTGFVAFTCDWTNHSTDPACVIDGGRDGAEASWEIVTLQSGGSLTNYLDGVSVNISDVAFEPGPPDPPIEIKTVVYTWTPTERQIYVDGVLVNNQSSALVVENIGRWTLGMKGSLDNAWTAEGLKMFDVQVGTTHVTSGDAAAYHAFMQGEVGF